MIFFETRTQFIKVEEGITIPDGKESWDLYFPTGFNQSDSIYIPKFELQFSTRGGYPYKCIFQINYKGYTFYPSRNKYSSLDEYFIIEFLNDLKRGDYQDKIYALIKDSLEAECPSKSSHAKGEFKAKLEDYTKYRFNDIYSLTKYEDPKIKQLEKEVSELKTELKNNDISKLEMLKEENNKLKDKLSKIETILQ